MSPAYLIVGTRLFRSSRIGFVLVDTLPTFLVEALRDGRIPRDRVIEWHEQELQARQAKRALQGPPPSVLPAVRGAGKLSRNRSEK